jgi:hypothetical protein
MVGLLCEPLRASCAPEVRVGALASGYALRGWCALRLLRSRGWFRYYPSRFAAFGSECFFPIAEGRRCMQRLYIRRNYIIIF